MLVYPKLPPLLSRTHKPSEQWHLRATNLPQQLAHRLQECHGREKNLPTLWSAHGILPVSGVCVVHQFKPFQVSKVCGKKVSHKEPAHSCLAPCASGQQCSQQAAGFDLSALDASSFKLSNDNQMIVGASGWPLSQCHIRWNPSMLSFHTKVAAMPPMLSVLQIHR